ncbi:MAG: acyltransferase family protein [Reyranellaceae bacterium]
MPGLHLRPDVSYRADIDGLRGLAVMAVVLFHAFPGLLPGGFVGVDAFFVVSGYLITSILLVRLRAGTFGFGWFYARRIRRLVPALVVVLAACWALGWVELLPDELARLSKHIVSAAVFLNNVTLWSEASYFDSAADSKPLLHLWSLAVEEQYYLFWPVVLLAAWRWGKRTLAATLALLVASFVVNLVLVAHAPTAAFFLPFGRIWELSSGAALAQISLPWTRPAQPSSPTRANAAAVLGVTLLAASLLIIDATSAFPGWLALLPVGGASLLVAAGPQAVINRRLLATRGLVALGLISYPLYLWHWPLLSFASIAGLAADDVVLRLGLVALSLVLAAATYWLVERPIRRGSGSWQPMVCLAGLAAVAGLAATTLGGAPERVPETVRRIADYTYDPTSRARFGQCWLQERDPDDGFARDCIETHDPASAVFLWGDSYAARLSPGLRMVLPDSVTLLQATRNGCAPILGGGEPTCFRSNRFVINQLRRLQPATVILFAWWSAYGSAWDDGSALAAAFANTLADVRAAGVRRIVVVGPAPEWNQPLPRLLATAWLNHPEWTDIPERLGMGLAPRAALVDRRMRKQLASAGVTYVAALPLLCDDQGCLTRIPGSQDLSTWDTGHLTDEGAKHLARGIVEAMGLAMPRR